MKRTATITLHIDPEVYLEESGQELTEARLVQIASEVNNDSACIAGYSAWQIGWDLHLDTNEQIAAVASRRVT